MSGSSLRLGVVMGTRPEVIKNYSIIKALRRAGIEFHVLHTGQHSRHDMNRAFFDELGYQPDFQLEGDHEIGRAIDWLQERIRALGLNLILVNGDTAAALAGAIAAVYSDVGLAHVEAGLRSFDTEMYEERNRIMVDAAAHYLFTYTAWEKERLEGMDDLRGRIFNVGNTTVDLIADFDERLAGTGRPDYAFVTLHRKEFTDHPRIMLEVFGALAEVAERIPEVLFPMHPRTRDAMLRHGIPTGVLGKVEVLEPVGCLEALTLEKHAKVILTDSGCIQEEACIFSVPCITIRENTERQGTVAIDANILTGFDRGAILDAVTKQLAAGDTAYPPIYGSPGVGERIVNILASRFTSFRDY